MRNNLRNTNSANRLISHLAAEKKKTAMALCLIALMAFMWVRVLFRKLPATEGAEVTEQINVNNGPNSTLKISFIELPKVVGRNDVITRNFFVSNDWQDFKGNRKNIISIEELNVVPGNDSEKAIRTIVEKIKLEAIVMGENAKTFINNKVLSVGDKLLISDGVDKYECEIVVIEENAVVIRCGEAEVKLKIKQVNENSE